MVSFKFHKLGSAQMQKMLINIIFILSIFSMAYSLYGGLINFGTRRNLKPRISIWDKKSYKHTYLLRLFLSTVYIVLQQCLYLLFPEFE